METVWFLALFDHPNLAEGRGEKSSAALKALISSRLHFEIACGYDDEFLRINMLSKRRIDLLRRQADKLFLEIGFVGHGASQMTKIREHARQRGIVGPRDLLRLQITLPGILQLISGD